MPEKVRRPAVAANQALFGLGTETGGSVRLPASYCGIYGLKPTYGVLSRWGVVAYGSSLDQVGILGHTPQDIATPLSLMCGVDFFDDTKKWFAGKMFGEAKILQLAQAWEEEHPGCGVPVRM